jgi:PEP-CTERM motif
MLWQRLKSSTSLTMALAVVLAIAAGQVSYAATISYGNFGPTGGVMFNDVKESSGTDAVPLFGPPEVFPIGMDFDPTGFVATASGGNEDITDGQLNFTVMGSGSGAGSIAIGEIRFFEAGDYTLSGVGTNLTQVMAGLSARATVTQIDGVNVAPIDLTQSSASVGFNLAANPGIVRPWTLGLSFDVAAQLRALGRPFAVGATKVEVVIDNQLIALSQPESLAFIAKKEFRVDIDRDFIPEPSTFVLLGLALSGWGLVARRSHLS